MDNLDNKKNRPLFPQGYKKKIKKVIPSYFIKQDKKITKPEFKFGRFIIEF
jgi:hypothetical protein